MYYILDTVAPLSGAIIKHHTHRLWVIEMNQDSGEFCELE